MGTSQLALLISSLVDVGGGDVAATEDVAQYNGTNNIVQVGYGVEVLFLQFTRESVESRDAFVVFEVDSFEVYVGG